jgi:hypothetical protein
MVFHGARARSFERGELDRAVRVRSSVPTTVTIGIITASLCRWDVHLKPIHRGILALII